MSCTRAVSLYKRILKAKRKWEAASGSQSESIKERNYIINEARRLFQLNKNLTDGKSVEEAIKEGESRLAIAIHYKNPWPRPTHIPQHSMLPLTARKKHKSDRILGQSKPAYLRSYDIGDKDKVDKR